MNSYDIWTNEVQNSKHRFIFKFSREWNLWNDGKYRKYPHPPEILTLFDNEFVRQYANKMNGIFFKLAMCFQKIVEEADL